MLENIAGKFCRDVGDDSLLPVPNLDEAIRCIPLQVVIKKRRHYFWQSPKYTVTPFQLHQLLDPQEPIDKSILGITHRKLTNYDRTGTFSLKGKFGAKIKPLLEIDLSGVDTINVSAKLGDIMKDEVDQTALFDLMQQKKLNMHHDYIRRISSHRYNVMCVIVGSVTLAQDATIGAHTDIGVNASEGVEPKANTHSFGGESASGSVEEKIDHDMLIPAGTPIAYNMAQVFVKEDGSMQLVLDNIENGGFEPHIKDTLDGDDDIDVQYKNGCPYISKPEVFTLCKVFQKLPCDKRVFFNRHLLKLCSTPVDLETMIPLFKNAMRTIQGRSVKDITNPINFVDSENALYLLDKAGIEMGDTVIYPTKTNPWLEALMTVIEAMMELRDEVALMLSEFTYDEGSIVLEVLAGLAEYGNMTSFNMATLQLLTRANYPGLFKFFTELGITTDDPREFKLPGTAIEQCQVYGAYRVCYAIWGKPEKKIRTFPFSNKPVPKYRKLGCKCIIL